jgi:hypothetical protein
LRTACCGLALEGLELAYRYQAQELLAQIAQWYNQERLHRALGYWRLADYYPGCPRQLQEARRRKLAEARHRRRERNLALRQRTMAPGALESSDLEPRRVVATH